MPNYALTANNAYTPNVYGGNLFTSTDFNPQDLITSGRNVSNEAPNLFGAANTTFNQAADPQMAQYDFYNQKVLDAINAQEAARGIAMTPAGAGVTGQTEADFSNQWALNQSQKMAQALAAMTGAYGGASSTAATGGQLQAGGSAFQQSSLSNLIQSLLQNYTQPQQNIANQLGFMGAANAQNQTSVASAQQQNQAALLNSPLAFLGALGGSVGGPFLGGFGQGAGKAAATAAFA